MDFKKLVIACDLDDTITNFVESWLNLYNNIYQDNVKKEDIKTWNIANYVKCGNKIYDLLIEDRIFLDARIKDNAFEILEKINKIHNLYIVTAYNYNTCKAKVLWIKQNLSFFDLDKIVFMNNKKLFKANVLIDDNPEFLDFDGETLLFTEPWNEKIEYNFRVDDWLDIEANIWNLADHGVL